MNPTAIIQPYLERFLLGEKKEWSEVILEASRETALSALSLPGELHRVMERAMRGDLQLRIRNLEDSAGLIYQAGQQLLWGMLGATASVLAVVFDGRGQGRAMLAAGISAGFCGLMLALSWLGGRSVAGRR